jgi:hypothetical protein
MLTFWQSTGLRVEPRHSHTTTISLWTAVQERSEGRLRARSHEKSSAPAAPKCSTVSSGGAQI